MCEVLGVSRSGYNAWVKRPESQQKKRQEALKSKSKRFISSQEKRMAVQKSQKSFRNKGLRISKNGRQNHERW